MAERNLRDFFNELQLQDDFFERLTTYVAAGNTEVHQSRVIETMVVDDTWIRTIEDCMFSIESIVRDPRKFIVDEYDVVNVEKAKRTGSHTVKHLASHTGLIRAIEDDGFVNPSKILVKQMEEDVAIYENRFVFTLINNLFSFIEQRYRAIKDNIDTFDITNLRLNSKFNLKKGNVEYSLNMKVKNEPTNGVLFQKNFELLSKIEMLRKRILALHATPFYKTLTNAKPVLPPIMKTNIINMQKHYKNCYKLWIFICSYTQVGYSVEVSDKLLPVDNEYYDDLAMVIAISLKTMVNNHALRRLSYKKSKFRRHPKRHFRENREIEYETNFRNVGAFDDKQALNQFYYDKIREMVMKKEEIRASDLNDKVKVETSFRQFFNSVTSLTNELYSDIIGISKIKEPEEKQSTFQKISLAYRRQEELCKKYAQLSKLKAAELQKTLIRENTQKVKLERLKFEFNLALEKRGDKNKKKHRKLPSKKLVDERNKLSDLFLVAEKDDEERMAREIARQEEILAKEEAKRELLRLAREEQKKIREIAKEILKQRELDNFVGSSASEDSSDSQSET
ncbi:MAG: hypothetical protein LBU04_04630 [Christensenellaceae bacterium]|jgi:hypothetical protein|nr:hypothetical protein [Christensenellaceae bacterium]